MWMPINKGDKIMFKCKGEETFDEDVRTSTRMDKEFGELELTKTCGAYIKL
jgi:hypothetical protein